MRDIDLILLTIGGLVLILGVFSHFIKSRSGMSAPLMAFLVGLVLGPHVLDVLDPADWGSADAILEEAARVTLAIGLMALALRLPPRYIQQEWKTLLVLIGLLMPAMWLISGVFTFLLLDTTIVAAALLGAIITPTDPVVASSIVTGKTAEEHLPGRMRHVLSGESGLNDGLALLFVMLPILWLVHGGSGAAGPWLIDVLLHQVTGGMLIGVTAGLASGKLLLWAEEHHAIERSSFLSYTVALALLTLGIARLAGTDGILAVFVAGVAFDGMVGGGERAEEADVQETVNQFFSVPIFALVGLAAPVPEWVALGWRGVALAAAILLLRRLPAMLALRRLLPSLHGRRDILFVGWFGPIGVSAVLYATMATRHTGLDVWPVASLIICASVAIHGITATPFMKRYSRAERMASEA